MASRSTDGIYVDATKTFLIKQAEEWLEAEKKVGHVHFTIYEKSTGDPVGKCGFMDIMTDIEKKFFKGRTCDKFRKG